MASSLIGPPHRGLDYGSRGSPDVRTDSIPLDERDDRVIRHDGFAGLNFDFLSVRRDGSVGVGAQ
jgi:hypothetical protein